MQRPRRTAWQRNGWRTVKKVICLQRFDEGPIVISTLGRPPTQGPPMDFGNRLHLIIIIIIIIVIIVIIGTSRWGHFTRDRENLLFGAKMGKSHRHPARP